ncbi:type II toxin-antitoxin system VapC family toxin [bacterium]|nr:type II toxin-antitoxin system VapC family toxin [bacterium]MCI0605682.1 type II toxin-antitoxin system VapC family toxin [bacterium]
MVLIDSNIPMYLIGKEHPLKIRAIRLCHELILQEERLVTDTEVLQEILHRYTAIKRRDAIQPCFDALLGIVDRVLPVDLSDVQKAKELLLGYKKLSARDALHASIMQKHEIVQILTFDIGFDLLPGLTRIH